MTDEPDSLREALRDAVEALTAVQIEAHLLAIPVDDAEWQKRFYIASNRVAALIDQIPIEPKEES